MDNDLQAHRDFYAKYIVASGGSSNERLVSAFQKVRREDYLGNGPWLIFTPSGYLPSISDDPRHVYHDVVVALMAEKKINNGQPSLHAKCLAAIDPAAGETVVHVGAGTGYYTAILSDLIGSRGCVYAYEIEEELCARGAKILHGLAGVRFECANPSERSIPRADVIYVNAGVTRLPDHWLDALKPGGRLIAPLTPNEGFGGMLMITRHSTDAFAAEIVARVGFIPCKGSRSDAESIALAEAFETRSFRAVRSLRRHEPPDKSAWYVASNWWLSTTEPLTCH